MKPVCVSTGCFFLLFTLCFQLYAEVTVTISEPAEGTVFSPCSDVPIKFDYTATAGEEIKQIYLYYNGQKKKRLRKEPWEYVWKNIPKGAYELMAELETRDDETVWSEPVRIKAGDVSSGEKLYNGGFDCGSLSPLWRAGINSEADARIDVLDDGYFEDTYYLSVDIYETGPNRWSVQLFHRCPLDSGHTYEISFLADAMPKKVIYVGMQESQEPWTAQFGTEIEIDGYDFYGPYEFTATKTDPTNDMVFHFASDDTPVYMDNVQVIDRSATAVKPHTSGPDQGHMAENSLLQAFPNPFNMNTTVVYELENPSRVHLEIYNMAGQKIKTLADGHKTSGRHSVRWDGTDDKNRIVPSGVYLYTLGIDNGSERRILTNKVLLLK